MSSVSEYTGSVTSLITDEEELEAKRMIEEGLGFPMPKVLGNWLLIKLHVDENEVEFIRNEDGSASSIIKPESIQEREKWKQCVGLVVAKGPSCRRDDSGKYIECGPWHKIGDFVVFARHEGRYLVYRGVPMYVIPYDKSYSIIDEPNDIKRG